ncbi:TonB-dependent receptor domain-containing protein [Asticcacaulis sp. 201]|uniref:TonB-dependent receptor domain-containing protein n=1 Tax=Asticcacaulis sp. 201 TaxID=3028787 RepID=UPI002915CA89|nr:TonB-dependent receptor [Asticcacaulis sp. 201]MDV6330654.1 TonB-dependent receptor [Asticcacaulis sp. 201]
MNSSKNTHARLVKGVSLAVLGAALACGHALAQDEAAPAKAAPADDTATTVIVTGGRNNKTKMQTSMSISAISAQQIQDFTPRSEAEVFRLIPGIQAQDTAGPGGNSNIGVRGLPVVTGGSEFVQLQEDGLPTVLFGDMNFGNNDYWTRYDATVQRVEAVRGGGASTFASQAPGAIINYISDTGTRDGGMVALSRGLGFDETKIDFAYGGHISDTLRFHVGGFVKNGSGPTHIGYNAEQGYQIKGNITKELDGGKGYIRLTFKRLDDKEPTYTTMPSIATLSGNTITGFKPMPNFDARTDGNQSIYNQTFQVLNNSGQLETVPMEGIHVKSTAIGGEYQYDFSENLSVHDALRWTEQSGTFRTQFLNVATTASVIGSTVNGRTVGSILYANGPNQGKAYTGTYLNNNPNIDTNMSDMGSFVNDLTLTGKHELSFGTLTAKAGWFYMRQTIAQDWHVNRSYAELSGDNPAQLDLFTGPNGTGTQLTAAGQAGFNDNWGSCCSRAYDLTYVDDAPYLSLDLVTGPFDIDASIRQDSIKASGSALGGVTGPNTTVTDALGTAVLPSLIAGGTPEVLDYTKKYTSWSIGALYKLTPNTNLFARASRGGRFNADRRILGGNFNADGSLNAQGETTAVNFVEQKEIGVKRQARFHDVAYDFEATYFTADLTDNNYDFTRITLGLDPVISEHYSAHGFELSGNLRYGHFSLYGDGTIIDAKVKSTGIAPGALPDYTFLLSPSYTVGKVSVGVSINGQGKSYASSGQHVDGQTFVNGVLKFRPTDGLELALNANNLFNTLGYRGSGNLLQTSATSGIFSNSAVLGRTVTASLRYTF